MAKHRKPNVLLMANRSFQFLSFVLLLLCKRSFHILIISTLLKLDFGLFIALFDCVVLIVCSLLARTLWPNKEEDDECHSGSYRGLNRITSGGNLFIAWYVPWNFGCFFSMVYIHYFVFTYFHCSFWWHSEFICWT